jgi:glycosyltransferase involved in cell wall biosynthesis
VKVLFAPDYRELVPYQQALADALGAMGATVEFRPGYRRLLPLYRSVSEAGVDVFHLHWIEHLFPRGARDRWRKRRFPHDLHWATRRVPLVYTAHDLYPVGWPHDAENTRLLRELFHEAEALILHSEGARKVVINNFGADAARCHIIPHGDLASAYGEPVPKARARAQLGLDERPVCLAFGAILANKGLDELVEWWARTNPDVTLAVVGHAYDVGYARRLNQLGGGSPRLELRFGFQSDSQVNSWFSAVDCAVINYAEIFTSGVACLARSRGVPLLVPRRLTTIELAEPHPHVLHYDSLDSDFTAMLQKAVDTGTDYEAGAEWRRNTAWPVIAAKTMGIYEAVLAMK